MSSCEAKVSNCSAIYISSHNNRNTVKVLIGCALSVLVTLLSPAYGGLRVIDSVWSEALSILNVIQAMKLWPTKALMSKTYLLLQI